MENRPDIALHMNTIKQFASLSRTIVEVGPDFGNGSTRAIWESIKEDQISGDNVVWVTVDIDDHILPECRPTFKNWHMVVGDSRLTETVEKVKAFLPEGTADLIFIDTIHEKDFLAKELQVWQRIANSETVWLFHDTWMLGEYNRMTDAIKEFATSSPLWAYVDLSKECNGLGALLPKHMEEVYE